ncbi:MAG TPA: hypothetical protein VGD01_11735 [Candidatus Elarobacter sp.]
MIVLLARVGMGVANATGISTAISAASYMAANSASKHAPEWSTAIATLVLAAATVLLWRATRALSRSTNVQFAVDGPYISLFLYPDGGIPALPSDKDPFRAIDFGQYSKTFTAEDAANVNLLPLLTDPPSYLNLIVLNRGSKPISIASDIEVTATLYFGAPGGASPHHPFSLTRNVSLKVLDAQSQQPFRLFNVGGLTGYQVSVSEIRYKDITGRDRRAAHGTGTLMRQPPDVITLLPTLYKPRKGEFTDAVHR